MNNSICWILLIINGYPIQKNKVETPLPSLFTKERNVIPITALLSVISSRMLLCKHLFLWKWNVCDSETNISAKSISKPQNCDIILSNVNVKQAFYNPFNMLHWFDFIALRIIVCIGFFWSGNVLHEKNSSAKEQ